MIYDGEKLKISDLEFINACIRRLAPIPKAAHVGGESENTAHLTEKIGDYTLEIAARLERVVADTVNYTHKSLTRGKKITDEDRKTARGILFLRAYALAKRDGLKAVTLNAEYVLPTGEIKEECERVKLSELEGFYKKCLTLFQECARPEIERVTERLLSMRTLCFPYKEKRAGQGELIRAVYRNIARGTHLFCEAPTGTGKTVSVLYPALRALGDGRITKVFYLTPKATAMAAARECITSLCEGGLKIRSVILSAKEKICTNYSKCQINPTACKNKRANLAKESLMIYDLNRPVIDLNDIRRVAQETGACPYELSLDYSELCDVIILDINYAFDTAVYLKRYFDRGGDYALLIDEAHNLEARAREMYSAELSDEVIKNALSDYELLPEHSACRESLSAMLPKLDALFSQLLHDNERVGADGVKVSFAYSSELPPEMYTIICNLKESLGEEYELQRRTKNANFAPHVKKIKDLYYESVKLADICDRFGEGYKLLVRGRGDTATATLFCIDTGRVLKERLSKIKAAIFFSATLEPLDYYSAVLGAGEGADTVTVGSPFSSDALCVRIMENVSTRYSERTRTLPEIVRTIAATLSARRGHYMVFCPSFEYLTALHTAFTNTYPKIKTVLQQKLMTDGERNEFLRQFEDSPGEYLVGFAVMGGIYGEGIDLVGDTLIGAIVIGIGMPTISDEREAICEYFEEKYERGREFAYIYPGMNRVWQAAGRVIRRESDRGTIVLIDDRFLDPIYKKSIPDLWKGMRYCKSAKALNEDLNEFWQRIDKEKSTQP